MARLLPLPLLVYWLSPEFRDRGEALRTPFFGKLVALTGRDPETGAVVLTKSFWQKMNILLIWVLIVTALARPQWAEEPIVREKAARDLLLVVDLSGSMEAKDFTGRSGELITRLEHQRGTEVSIRHDIVSADVADIGWCGIRCG